MESRRVFFVAHLTPGFFSRIPWLCRLQDWSFGCPIFLGTHEWMVGSKWWRLVGWLDVVRCGKNITRSKELKPRWWLQTFFTFTPTRGNDLIVSFTDLSVWLWGTHKSNLTNIFQMGLKPPTRNFFCIEFWGIWWEYPRDLTETENGSMEPKYDLPFGSDWTPLAHHLRIWLDA